MSYLSADQIDKKFGAKKLFKFMRHGCNQTVTGKEERHKDELCQRAAGLNLSESEVDDWLDDEDTQIARFWLVQQPPQQVHPPQQLQPPQQSLQQQQQGQDGIDDDEDEGNGGDDACSQDTDGEEIDDTNVTMRNTANGNRFATLQDHGQSEHADPGSNTDSQHSHSHFHPNLNQAAGLSSSPLLTTSNLTPGHLTHEQIRLIREAETIWDNRRLEMMAAGLEDTFENWIHEPSYVRLGQMRTEAVMTNTNEFFALKLGWDMR